MKTNTKTPQKNLILGIGAKGGTGKTVTITGCADYFAAKGRKFIAVDCDQANRGKQTSFANVFPEDSVSRLDLRDKQECENLIVAAAESETGLVIADLPGSCSPDFLSWWQKVCSPENLSELNLRVIVVGVITPKSGTFAAVADWAAVMQGSVSYVIALNRFSDSRLSVPIEKLMPEYFASATGKQFREVFKPVEIEIPALEDPAMTALLLSGALPSVASTSPSIFVMKRSLIRTWTAELHEQFAKVDKAFNLS